MINPSLITVVIPTYNRQTILLATIELLLNQKVIANEILVMDQSNHDTESEAFKQLSCWNNKKKIKWVRLEEPSIPAAMNAGLILAKSDYVLFLDDDVSFNTDFINAHQNAIKVSQGSAHVGQILQPGETGREQFFDYQSLEGLWRDLAFPFRSNQQAAVHNCMAGNLLVTKQAAIDCGGFDEQFHGVAYRFETDFCRRMIAFTGKPFHFYPAASLDHLKVSTGGTRNEISSYLTSWSPSHSEGDYYFALRHGKSLREKISYIFMRFLGCLKARFYLTKPWWIPIRLIGEVRGILSAIIKIKEGPKLLT